MKNRRFSLILLSASLAGVLSSACDAQTPRTVAASGSYPLFESGSRAPATIPGEIPEREMMKEQLVVSDKGKPGPGPYGQNAADYRLTFADEFEHGFNHKLWNETSFDRRNNPTRNFAVENGSLKIWPQRDANGKFFNRVIDTDGKFYQTYGYFEIEAKLPRGKGTWPAFWLYNHDDEKGTFRPEIDIIEAYPGGGPESGWSDARLHPTAFAVTVWSGEPEVKAGSKMMEDVGDLSAKFHKYALKWEPDKQTFYFDGKEIYTLNISMRNRMYVLLDLFFGSDSGEPDHTTPTGKSNSFEIKYVRVWQFKKMPKH